jgi:ribosomal protein L37AE/L43A
MDEILEEITRECPQCQVSYPLDRFNDKNAECFKCRIKTIGVSFGPAGKAFWHGTTNKEYIDKTISEARANGNDPIPVHSASVPIAGSLVKKLETAAKTPPTQSASKVAS